MKTTLNIISRVFAIALIVLMILPFFQIVFTPEDEDKEYRTISILEYATDSITGDDDEDGLENYDLAQDMDEDYLPFILAVPAVIILIFGTSKPVISAVASLAGIPLTLLMKLWVRDQVFAAIEEYTTAWDEELFSLNPAIGMYAFIAVCAIVVLMCIIAMLMPKSTKTVTPHKTYKDVTTSRVAGVDVPGRKAAASEADVCPVCENIIMPGVSFCTSCGTPVAKKAEVAPTPAPVPGMMACPNCNAIIDGSSAFCTSCGTSLAKKAEVAPTPAPVPGMMACPSCNAIIDGSSAFCTSCGTPIAKKTVEVTPEPKPSVATTSSAGIKSTMRTKPSESPEEAMKKAAGQSFFNKPSDL